MSVYDLLQPVQSSMFTRAAYDEQKWELVVEYKSTTEIRGYIGVSPEVAEQVLTAKSIGSAFNQLIKGKYEHTIYGADPRTAAPLPPSKPIEGGLTDEDINAVLGPGTAAQTTQAIEGSEEQASAEEEPEPESKSGPEEPETPAEPPSDQPVPKMDVAAAIAWPASRAPQINSIVEEGHKLAREGKGIIVKDALSYQSAAAMLKRLLAARERSFNFLDPIRRAIYNAYILTRSKQQEALDPIDTAINHLKWHMGHWMDQQERMRLERVAQENRAAEDRARELKEDTSAQLTLAAVNDALEAGNEELAEELMAHPIEAPLPYVPPNPVESMVPAVDGFSRRKNWQVQKTNVDLEKFLHSVKDGTIPVARAAKLILPNFPALNKMANSLETAFDIAGFHAHNPGVVVVTRRKTARQEAKGK